MTTLKLIAGSQAAANVLTTEMNSLANGSASALGTALANQTNLDMVATAELNVTFASAPTVDTTVELWLVPAIDNTNYGDWTSGASPRSSGGTYCGAFVLDAVTTAQRKPLKGQFYLPAVSVKFAVINRAAVAFPASGSTVKLTTWNLQNV